MIPQNHDSEENSNSRTRNRNRNRNTNRNRNRIVDSQQRIQRRQRNVINDSNSTSNEDRWLPDEQLAAEIAREIRTTPRRSPRRSRQQQRSLVSAAALEAGDRIVEELEEEQKIEDELPPLMGQWEYNPSERVHHQRFHIEQLLDLNRRSELQIDRSMIPEMLFGLRSMCSCPHGLRTLGVCAHRLACLILLRDWWHRREFTETRLISQRIGNQQHNIEKWPNYKEPGRPPSGTDSEGETTSSSDGRLFVNHDNDPVNPLASSDERQ